MLMFGRHPDAGDRAPGQQADSPAGREERHRRWRRVTTRSADAGRIAGRAGNGPTQPTRQQVRAAAVRIAATGAALDRNGGTET